jgi:hypothetical protein
MRTADGKWTVELVNRDGVPQFKVTCRGFDLIPYGSKRKLLSHEDVRAAMARHEGGEDAFAQLEEVKQ